MVSASRDLPVHAKDGLQDDGFVFTTTGTISSVAEVGEILVWINAALSLSNLEAGVSVSDPVLKPRTRDSTLAQPGIDNFADCNISANLGTEEYDITDSRCAISSDCWGDILGNTVFVKGYPTARRAEHYTGMEVSLSTMISLARSRRLSRFNGNFCIKGYCSIVIPIRKQGDSIYWHLITNHNGAYVSYVDYRVQKLWKDYPRDLSIRDLEKGRHILGWCDNVQIFAGMFSLNMSSLSTQNSYVLFLQATSPPQLVSVLSSWFSLIGFLSIHPPWTLHRFLRNYLMSL